MPLACVPNNPVMPTLAVPAVGGDVCVWDGGEAQRGACNEGEGWR